MAVKMYVPPGRTLMVMELGSLMMTFGTAEIVKTCRPAGMG